MNDTGRLIERVGERAPFPDDAFERMLGRRHRKQRNRRVAAAAVGIAIFVAVVALALGTIQRSAPVPIAPPSETGPVFTFFGPDGMVSVDGAPVKTTSGHPESPPGTPEHELDYRYLLAPVIEVPAGARIDVVPEGSRGWVDAYDLSQPAQRLYELDLDASPTMPQEPGTYYLELEVAFGDLGIDEGGGFTFLVPIRVVSAEDS